LAARRSRLRALFETDSRFDLIAQDLLAGIDIAAQHRVDALAKKSLGNFLSALTPFLRPAGPQNDDRLTITSEINPIARTKIDPIFQHALSHAFYIGEIALLHAGECAGDLGAGRRVQFFGPFGEGCIVISAHFALN
jgi:hypothetical protein